MHLLESHVVPMVFEKPGSETLKAVKELKLRHIGTSRLVMARPKI